MLDTLKPDQNITLTVTKVPAREAARQTIERLMRQDPQIQAALRRTQEHRRKTTITRSRGRRPFVMRQRRTLIAIAEQGASWTMPYCPKLRHDLASVARFLEIKPA